MLVTLISWVAPGSNPARKNNKASGIVRTELPLNVLVDPFKDTEYNPLSGPIIALIAIAVPPVNDSETLAPLSVVAWNGAEIVELGIPLTVLVDHTPEYEKEAVSELS